MVIVVAADGSGTHATIEAGVAALEHGSHLTIRPKPQGGQWELAAPLLMPNVNNVTVEGQGGKHGTVLRFPGDGMCWDGSTRNSGWIIRNIRLNGGAVDAQWRGVSGVGLDASGLDRSTLESVRVHAFQSGIYADGTTQSSQHTLLQDLRVTNCATGVSVVGGAGGVTQWHWRGGEISGNGAGIHGVTGAGGFLDGWTMFGTAFESNDVALRWAGNYSTFDAVRFEGNGRDAFITGVQNELRTRFPVKG